MGKTRIVFLDRDGTLSIDHGYTITPVGLKLFPGTAQAVGNLKKAGFAIVIVSNQSAVGRGIGTIADVEATNREVERLLKSEDAAAEIDAVVFCPHHPDENCLCRKPRAGLVDLLPFRHDFVAGDSWVVGDKLSDLQFGLNAGLPLQQCVLVQTGEGRGEVEKAKAKLGEGFLVAEDLLAASKAILQK